MTTTNVDPADVQAYHAHVYFRPETRAEAQALREALAAGFRVQLGSWHDRPVGPHTEAMYLVGFPARDFATLVPWLMLNHGGLDILVHPETGDDLADHTAHALWIGRQLPLRTEIFARA